MWEGFPTVHLKRRFTEQNEAAMRRPTYPYDLIRSWYGMDTDWMGDGLCAEATDAEREVFFWDDSRSVHRKIAVERQKQVCHECPVEATCLAFAIDAGMEGVWGGMTKRERTLHVKQQALAKVG